MRISPSSMAFTLSRVLLAAALGAGTLAHAQTAVEPGKIVLSGAVPDEATKASVLARMRELYGADLVVDQMTVGGVVTPANWAADVRKALGYHIKSISHGQVTIDGTTVTLKGEVNSEATRQQVASDFATALNANYTIRNALRVAVSEQSTIDDLLANRTVEFESGSAVLTPAGKTILDEVIAVIKKMPARRVDIIGHTDGEGARSANIALSLSRAEAVKLYLRDHGIDPSMLQASGLGPDQPIASNTTAAGRARNRRIEFRVGS